MPYLDDANNKEIAVFRGSVLVDLVIAMLLHVWRFQLTILKRGINTRTPVLDTSCGRPLWVPIVTKKRTDVYAWRPKWQTIVRHTVKEIRGFWWILVNDHYTSGWYVASAWKRNGMAPSADILTFRNGSDGHTCGQFSTIRRERWLFECYFKWPW